MRALLYKDFIALKKPFLLLIIVFSFISYYFYKENQIYILPLFFILLPVIILGMLFGSDSQDNTDQYLIPSPLKRSTIVLGRYLIVWLLSVIATILALLISILVDENPIFLPWYLIVPGMFLLASFISAIQLPLIYRFTENNARLIFFVLYFISFAFFSSIASNKEWLLSKLQTGFGFNIVHLSIGLALFAVILNGISYLISSKIYLKKEF